MILIDPNSDTSIVITSCGRPDLLDVTLQSFVDYFDEPVRALIVIEDSGYGSSTALQTNQEH